MKLKEVAFSVVLFGLLSTPAFAQIGGGALTLRFTSFAPILSLGAGILILIFPKLLRYIVGFYPIVVGLLGAPRSLTSSQQRRLKTAYVD